MRILVSTFWVFFILVGTLRTSQSQDRPNILWIVAEDISPFFGCYGSRDAVTPNVDAFAKRSHLFLRAYSTAPICSPSRSCLATGMYATSLGSQHLRCKIKLPKNIVPLAKIFRTNGYWTSLRGKTDYNFDPAGLFDDWSRAETPWQNCPSGKPFFAFWNLGSTHEGSGNRPERAQAALKLLPADAARDPAKVFVPPHLPGTPEMRRIWARYHELITVFDLEVGKALRRLKEDGLSENTIVFLMADHGLGLPRYKRWLHQTGLHVPLIVHLPKKYQGQRSAVSTRKNLVSYVDLPATALELAGIDAPKYFAGENIFSNRRSFVFGARDRADDMFDLSRSVFDGRYLYIRHYLPHLPPIQEGYIQSPVYKESYIELHRIHRERRDTVQSRKFWDQKPFEELYDLETDPYELENRASDRQLAQKKLELSEKLREWILETRDSGFLTEPELHRRAIKADVAHFTILRSNETYPIRKILDAADQASRPDTPILQGGSDPALDYWAIQQRIIRKDKSAGSLNFIRQRLKSDQSFVRATAAEALARLGDPKPAIEAFRELLFVEEPNLRLYVARSMALSLKSIKPLEKEVRAARQEMLAAPGSKRPWKDFDYSAFTCWALEWSLVKSGLNKWSDFQGL